MKKARVFVALMMVLLLSVGLLAGCGTPEPATTSTPPAGSESGSVAADGESLKIGFSIVTLNYPYYVRMKEGFEAACDEKGWEYVTTDAGLDAEKQVNDCQDLLLDDIDVLVITSWYPAALLDVYDQCEAEGIPVFLIDCPLVPKDAPYVTDIGTDSFEAGRIGGVWAANYYKGEGQDEINLVILASASELSVERVNGYKAGLEEGGLAVNVLQEFVGHSSREEAMTSAEDALTSYDNIDLIFAVDAQGGLGASDACAAANRTEVKVMAYDGEDEEIEKIDAGTNYLATIMQFPGEMAKETVNNIEKYMFEGATFDKQTYYPAGVYSADGLVMADDISAAA